MDPRADSTQSLLEALATVAPALEPFLRGTSVRLASGAKAPPAPLPIDGVGEQAVLAWLRDEVAPAGLPMASPGHSGWIPTVPSLVGAVAQLVATIAAPQKWWDHVGNELEQTALAWLRELLGLPERFVGSLVSGGAAATLVCLAAARQHAGERGGLDLAEEGLGALRHPRIYASEAAHHVIERAAAVLGLGRAALVRVPSRHPDGIDVRVLEAMVAEDRAQGRTPIAVVGTAGDANTGAIDDLAALREVSSAHGLWFHVDGSYGALGVLDGRLREALSPIATADSTSFDPHKWLGVPVGCGAAFVADRRVLERALAMTAGPYLTRAANHDRTAQAPFLHLGDSVISHTLEHTAPARGIPLCAVLAALGREGVRDMVVEQLELARYAATLIDQRSELELVAAPVLSICVFRYKPPTLKQTARVEAVNAEIVRRMHLDGTVTPSLTRYRNTLAIRACFTNPLGRRPQVEALVEQAVQFGAQIVATDR